MDGSFFGKPLVATRVTEVKPSAEPNSSLGLSGTATLDGVASDDPKLQALRDACHLAQSLKDHANALTARSQAKGLKDPMTVAQGCNSMQKAIADVEALIRQLDQALAAQSLPNTELTVHT
jgi:hypothetical protein